MLALHRSFPAVVLSLALVGPSVAGLSGCETSCSVDASKYPEVVDDGLVDVESGVYESVEWEGTWIEFPPKKRYSFRHGLGAVPRAVKTYVSFSAEPFAGKEVGNAAETAGNIVILERVTAESIDVRNDTCETFYLRVVASDPSTASTGVAGAPSAAGDAGGSSSD